jgi:hypothetical protein
MGNLHLVTGYAGTPHVASSDQGSFHEAFIRSGQFVLDVGAKFSASIVTNNQIRVNDGELMMQGRYVRMTPDSYVDLMIENGAQGHLRTDLIVARYTRNADTGIEECSLVVIKGTPAESNPAVPQHTTGIINADGALQHDFPLYKVSLSGLSIDGITALFEPEKSLYDSLLRLIGGTMAGNIAMAGHKVTGLGTPKDKGDAVPLEYANGAYAPAGYGLGQDDVPLVADINACTTPGFYRTSPETINLPDDLLNSATVIVTRRGTQVIQNIQRAHGGAIMNRYYNDGAWLNEWVTPPLQTGVEYRTIERYQGAAVYKKVDSSGNILWRKYGESQWHLQSSASYVAAATVE